MDKIIEFAKKKWLLILFAIGLIVASLTEKGKNTERAPASKAPSAHHSEKKE